MPAIITTGNCFLTGVAQVFGGRGTTRGTDGTNPGVKRRRSYPDLKPPFERNSGRMLDPSETTESTARIASAGTLQQDNEMVMFEQPDPRPGQLIAAATVPSTCRDSEFSHSQDTGAELTGLTTASVAAKGTSLGTITQHCTYHPYFFSLLFSVIVFKLFLCATYYRDPCQSSLYVSIRCEYKLHVPNKFFLQSQFFAVTSKRWSSVLSTTVRLVVTRWIPVELIGNAVSQTGRRNQNKLYFAKPVIV